MKKIAIFLVLVLMLSVLLLVPHPNVLAQTNNDTQDIKVLNWSYYMSTTEELLDVVGEIQNTGTNNLANVTIGATIFDAYGQDQGDSTGPAYTIYMASRSRNHLSTYHFPFHTALNIAHGLLLISQTSASVIDC